MKDTGWKCLQATFDPSRISCSATKGDRLSQQINPQAVSKGVTAVIFLVSHAELYCWHICSETHICDGYHHCEWNWFCHRIICLFNLKLFCLSENDSNSDDTAYIESRATTALIVSKPEWRVTSHLRMTCIETTSDMSTGIRHPICDSNIVILDVSSYYVVLAYFWIGYIITHYTY